MQRSAVIDVFGEDAAVRDGGRGMRELGEVNRVAGNLGADSQDSADINHLEVLVGLTARQITILELLAQGLSTRAIAHRLCFSHQTISGNIAEMFCLLRAATRTELVARAFVAGLLSAEWPPRGAASGRSAPVK